MSVNASAPRKMKDGVLRDSFLQIAAKTKAFPTTANGEDKATVTHVKMAIERYLEIEKKGFGRAEN